MIIAKFKQLILGNYLLLSFLKVQSKTALAEDEDIKYFYYTVNLQY